MNDEWKEIIGMLDKPEPSLCDGCRFAYHVAGGTSGWGGKTYPQRYCAALTIAIHGSGKQECERFEKKPE